TVPATPPTTTDDPLAADATSVTVDAAVDVEDVGYLKIGAEWMHYAGITRAASTTTLNNLTRGINGTTAASHASETTVYWGIAMPVRTLWNQLYYGTRWRLHAMNIT